MSIRPMLAALLVAALPAFAQPESHDRIAQLEEQIRRLEHRLSELEKGSAQPAPAAAPAPALESRVEQVEQRVARLDSPNALAVSWNNGLAFQNADKSISLQLGGRIQQDFAVIWGDGDELRDAVGDIKDGTEFRRARLELGGTFYESMEFKAQYDFADGSPGFRYVYGGFLDVPVVGNLRIGHFQEPFGMEQLNSSKFMTFIERGLTTALVPSYNSGAMFTRSALGQRATLSGGVFRETDNFGKASSNDGYNFTGRLTGLPVYADGGRRLVHLGAAASHKNVDNAVSFSSRPESKIAPVFVKTGSIEADEARLYGLEAAAVLGSLSLQSEYMQARTEGAEDNTFSAYYVMASYFLTGEHRPYDRNYGYFGRIRPRQNFQGFGRGGGAWEVALRLSGIDLDDGEVAGGELADTTAALNWYLNPNVRLMFNYIYADLDEVGTAHIGTTRVQFDF